MVSICLVLSIACKTRAISGIKTFTGNFNTSYLTSSPINQINFEDFKQSVVTKHEDQTISVKMMYMDHIHILENMENHLTNSFNLSNCQIHVRTEGYEIF